MLYRFQNDWFAAWQRGKGLNEINNKMFVLINKIMSVKLGVRAILLVATDKIFQSLQRWTCYHET